MASNTSSLILGISIVAAAAIVVASPLIIKHKNQNIISTTNGAVRLGEIYSEELKVKMEMKGNESGEVFIAVDENADDVYKAARKKLEVMIAANNQSGKSSEDKLSLKDAALKVPMTITEQTYVSYRGEYQPLYTVVIDEYEVSASTGANIDGMLVKIQERADKNLKLFADKHQLLKE